MLKNRRLTHIELTYVFFYKLLQYVCSYSNLTFYKVTLPNTVSIKAVKLVSIGNYKLLEVIGNCWLCLDGILSAHQT